VSEKKTLPVVGDTLIDPEHGSGEVVKIVVDTHTGHQHARVSFDDGYRVWLRADEFEQVVAENAEDE
jgi:hypothetical protein